MTTSKMSTPWARAIVPAWSGRVGRTEDMEQMLNHLVLFSQDAGEARSKGREAKGSGWPGPVRTGRKLKAVADIEGMP